MFMKIDRANLQQFEKPQWMREDLAGLGVLDLGLPETLVEVELAASPKGEDYLLSGRVTATLNLTCDRCLGPAKQPVAGTFQAWLVSEKRPGLDNGADAVLVISDAQPEVDTSEVVVEAIRLEIPSKTLCREDCRGLCPACGTDWNQQTCGCIFEEGDDRWAALLEISQQLEN